MKYLAIANVLSCVAFVVCILFAIWSQHHIEWALSALVCVFIGMVTDLSEKKKSRKI